MSRSVWTHSDSIETVFSTLGYGGYCERCEMLTSASDDNKCSECGDELSPDEHGDYQQDEFDCLVEDIQQTLSAKFPAFEKADRWPERESHCILANDLCEIVISEYCGLVSLGVVPNVDCCYEDISGLAVAWCEKNAAPFVRDTWGALRKIATMSNGESVFERI